jgi:hypothetical protein
LITTEAMVAERPKKHGGASAMLGGGMGGMAYPAAVDAKNEARDFARAFCIFAGAAFQVQPEPILGQMAIALPITPHTS